MKSKMIHVGSNILKINDQPLLELDKEQVRSLMMGPAGTKVYLLPFSLPLSPSSQPHLASPFLSPSLLARSHALPDPKLPPLRI